MFVALFYVCCVVPCLFICSMFVHLFHVCSFVTRLFFCSMFVPLFHVSSFVPLFLCSIFLSLFDVCYFFLGFFLCSKLIGLLYTSIANKFSNPFTFVGTWVNNFSYIGELYSMLFSLKIRWRLKNGGNWAGTEWFIKHATTCFN